MWYVYKLYDVFIWCIFSIMVIGKWCLYLIVIIGICFFIVSLSTGKLFLIPSVLSLGRFILTLNQQRRRIEHYKEEELKKAYNEISRLKENIMHYRVEKNVYEKRHCGMKSFVKNTFVVSITPYYAYNSFNLLKVLVKEKDTIKCYFVSTSIPRDILFKSFRDAHYVGFCFNGYYLLELNSELSCKMAYSVISSVLVCLRHIRRTDIIHLSVDTNEIPQNDSLFIDTVQYRPITITIESSQNNNLDQDGVTIEYTVKTIDDFLSRRRFYSNTNVKLNISFFSILDLIYR